MPRKKLLIVGAIAILLSLAAYIATTPKAAPIPVSKEEFAQDMKGLNLPNLKGGEREKALSELQETLKHVPVSDNADEARRLWTDPDLMRAMLSLKPSERAKLVGPSSERFRRAHQERIEKFFEISPEEQTEEIDRIIGMIESFDKMYKAMGGKEKDVLTDRIKRTTPAEMKEMVLLHLQQSDSVSRARIQEASRRFFKRWKERKSAAQRPVKKVAVEEKAFAPVSEKIQVARTVKDELGKLTVGDPVTIANLAEPGRPPKMIVARSGNQVGELPASKWMEYAAYLRDKRQIWAKVQEVDPIENDLEIEVTVK